MSANARLRRSSSARAASASARRSSDAPSALGETGASGAVGLRTAASATWPACARVNNGGTVEEVVDIQVVNDLVDQVARVLAEGVAAVYVAGDAERTEHLLAEAVRRGDRGGVEVGDRAHETVEARLDLGSRPGGQHACEQVCGVHGVHVGRAGAGQRGFERSACCGEPPPHAVAQLSCCQSRERNQQQLLERETFRDVARSECRDRVGLASPRTGLQHGDAARQRAADVEVAGRFDPSSLVGHVLDLEQPVPQAVRSTPPSARCTHRRARPRRRAAAPPADRRRPGPGRAPAHAPHRDSRDGRPNVDVHASSARRRALAAGGAASAAEVSQYSGSGSRMPRS